MNKKLLAIFKLLFAVYLVSLAIPAFSQITFDGKTAIMGGFATRTGTQSGFYFIENPDHTAGEVPTDKGKGKSIDARFMRFDEDLFQEANFDGLLYISAAIVGLDKASIEADDFYGNSFENENLNKEYYTIPNISKHSHSVANYKLIEFTGNKVHKSGFMYGGRIDWRSVGMTSNGFTYFTSNTGVTYHNSEGLITKFCFGADIGYRKNIGKFTSVTILAFDRNILKGKNTSVLSNPSIKTTLFYGKNLGLYTTFKYETQKGISGINYQKIPYDLSVFEIKVGGYFTSLRNL